MVPRRPVGPLWGVSRGGGATFLVRPSPTLELGVVGGVLGVLDDTVSAVVCVAGDVVQSCVSGLEAVVGYTIRAAEEAWEFVVQVGEQVISFVIRTISDVLSALTWLFQEIELTVEKLITWVGFLFDWDDILDTHRVFSNLAVQAMGAFSAGLLVAEVEIIGFLAQLGAQIEAAREAVMTKAGATSFTQAATTTNSSLSPTVAANNAALYTSPGGSFAYYQLQYGGTTNISDPTVSGIGSDIQAAFQALVKVLEKAWAGIEQTFQDLITLLQSPDVTLAAVLELLTADVLATVLAVATQLVADFFAVIGEITTMVMTALTSVVTIPVLSGLYGLITDGSDLTVLDGFALLLAIPATILYKLATGDAPFANGTFGLDTMTWEQIQTTLGRRPGALQLRSARGTTELEESTGMVVYSAVGGFAALIAEECNAILFPIAVNIEKDGYAGLASIVSLVRTAINVVGLAGSVPFDDDSTQQLVDRVMWGLSGIECMTAGVAATQGVWTGLNFKTDSIEEREAHKTTNELLARVDAGMCIFVGLVALGCDTYSFYLEAQETENSLSNPTFAWDYEKLFANYVADIALAAEGAATFMKDPYFKVPTLAVAVVFDGLTFVLDLARVGTFAAEELYYQAR